MRPFTFQIDNGGSANCDKNGQQKEGGRVYNAINRIISEMNYNKTKQKH